jgi:hypothetical protein
MMQLKVLLYSIDDEFVSLPVHIEAIVEAMWCTYLVQDVSAVPVGSSGI